MLKRLSHRIAGSRCATLARGVAAAAAILLASPLPTFAHDGSHALGTWNWALHLLLLLLMSALVYGTGVWKLWKKAGPGGGLSVWQAAAYMLGLAALFAAVISPVDALSGELFSVHMVQHLIIMLIAAPLLVAGKPLFVMLWALPTGTRQKIGQWWNRAERAQSAWDLLSHPLFVWILYALILWVWHIPVLYEAALRNQYVHDVQHAGFLTASLLFWWIVLNPLGRLKMDRGAGVLYLFTTSLHGTALGVFLALSPVPWYSYYEKTITSWNVTLLQDQQIAGLIMWMPMCLVYILLAAFIFTVWLREIESQDRRLARFAALNYRSGTSPPAPAGAADSAGGDVKDGA